MNENDAISKIKSFFNDNGGIYNYINQKKHNVTCKMREDGVEVDCLNDTGHKNFLPWGVFWQSVHVMLCNNGSALRGNAASKLGSEDLPFNSLNPQVQ
jgi:hypothetical protein